ncbi:MAG: hypothetical protein EXQ87_01840 [Alphaproteobacteria bacterium]|nr:hypothetical protein [Alphaproteobacteria bacterium]
MFPKRLLGLCAGILALAPAALMAEPAALSEAADPAQPVPAIAYQSPFTGFQSFRAEPPQPWVRSNERVRAVGGHGGALQEDGKASEPAGHGHPSHGRR